MEMENIELFELCLKSQPTTKSKLLSQYQKIKHIMCYVGENDLKLNKGSETHVYI